MTENQGIKPMSEILKPTAMQFISHKVFDLFNKFRIHNDFNIRHGIAENNWESTQPDITRCLLV